MSTSPESRGSNVLRASVLDAALTLGIRNETVAKWMFDPIHEADGDESVASPGLTSASTTTSEESGVLPYRYPGPNDRVDTPEQRTVTFDTTPHLLESSDLIPETSSFTFSIDSKEKSKDMRRKLTKAKPLGGEESDGGYISDGWKKMKGKRGRKKEKKDIDGNTARAYESDGGYTSEIPARTKGTKKKSKEQETSTLSSAASTSISAAGNEIDPGHKSDSTRKRKEKAQKTKSSSKTSSKGREHGADELLSSVHALYGNELDKGHLTDSASSSSKVKTKGKSMKGTSMDGSHSPAGDESDGGHISDAGPGRKKKTFFIFGKSPKALKVHDAVPDAMATPPAPPMPPMPLMPLPIAERFARSPTPIGMVSGGSGVQSRSGSPLSETSGRGTGPNIALSPEVWNDEYLVGATPRAAEMPKGDMDIVRMDGISSKTSSLREPSSKPSSRLTSPTRDARPTKNSPARRISPEIISLPNPYTTGQPRRAPNSGSQLLIVPNSGPRSRSASPMLSPDPDWEFIERGSPVRGASERPPPFPTSSTGQIIAKSAPNSFGGRETSHRPSALSVVPSSAYPIHSPRLSPGLHLLASGDANPSPTGDIIAATRASVLAYYNLVPPSPPPAGPLPSIPSSSPYTPPRASPQPSRRLLSPAPPLTHATRSALSRSHSPTNRPSLFAQSIPPIQRGKQTPFPAQPILPLEESRGLVRRPSYNTRVTRYRNLHVDAYPTSSDAMTRSASALEVRRDVSSEFGNDDDDDDKSRYPDEDDERGRARSKYSRYSAISHASFLDDEHSAELRERFVRRVEATFGPDGREMDIAAAGDDGAGAGHYPNHNIPPVPSLPRSFMGAGTPGRGTAMARSTQASGKFF